MITLIIGGSGSGKSEYAESICMDYSGKKLYIATMEPYGDEGRARIQRHHELRKGKNFETLECYTGLENLTPDFYEVILIECISNLVANELYSELGRKHPYEDIEKGILNLVNKCNHLVIVTNNTGEELQLYSEEMMFYQKELGRVNLMLGQLSTRVVEIHCGCPMIYKECFNEGNS